MSFANKSVSLAIAGLIFSSGVAFAQAGGADVPTDAKKQGEMEQPGSTGMSKKEAESGSMKNGGSMEKKSGSMEKKSGDKM